MTIQSIADWFYVPSWRRAPLPRLPNLDELKKQKQCWLVFTSKNEFGSELVRNLEQQGQEVISVIAGTRFAKLSDGTYTIEMQNRSHYSALLKEIVTLETPPQQVIHLWSLDARPKRHENDESFQRTQAQSFYSLLFLAQGLDEFKIDQDLDFTVVSDSVQEVTGEELLCPEKAMVLGPKSRAATGVSEHHVPQHRRCLAQVEGFAAQAREAGDRRDRGESV